MGDPAVNGPSLWLIVPLFAVGLVALWLGVFWLMARMGWRRFVERYGAAGRLVEGGRRFRFQSARILSGRLPVAYNNALTVTVGRDGVYVRPQLFLAFAHPPLLFPWRAITRCEATTRLRIPVTRLTVDGVDAGFELSGRAAKAVLADFDQFGSRGMKGTGR